MRRNPTRCYPKASAASLWRYVHCESFCVNPISSEMAAPRKPKLTGCVESMSQMGLTKNFYLSTFKKLTFAEPRMLKLGWWGGQITRILSLFKKPHLKPLHSCCVTRLWRYVTIFVKLLINYNQIAWHLPFLITEMLYDRHCASNFNRYWLLSCLAE